MKKEMKNAIEALGYKVYGNYVMVDEILYPLPLVFGNDKIGDVHQSSTLPTSGEIVSRDKDGNETTEKGTCPMTCPGCYGTCGFYRFNSTKYILTMRTRLLRRHPKAYFELVKIQCKYENVHKLRIHVTGDFIEGEADGFRQVLAEFPGIISWTYTKNEGRDDIERLNEMPNCNVVKSVLPNGHGLNYGTVAHVASNYYYLKREGKSVYICRCGIDPNQHCDDCTGCTDHEYVLFLEHSTGYDPTTDYGYDKLVELINNQ